MVSTVIETALTGQYMLGNKTTATGILEITIEPGCEISNARYASGSFPAVMLPGYFTKSSERT
jgi:hypothetical protein